ncbi:MAG: putative 2-aminoethylphosphonate ABC transporter permease subunit, partial [Shewanella sp.]
PVCMPALFDIGMYLFVNALTTTSAVVFLYSTETIPASVSVLNMDDAGQTGAAAAMAVMIMLSAVSAKLIQWPVATWLANRTQAWRNK